MAMTFRRAAFEDSSPLLEWLTSPRDCQWAVGRSHLGRSDIEAWMAAHD